MKLRPGLAKGLLIGVPVSIALYAIYWFLLSSIAHLIAWLAS